MDNTPDRESVIELLEKLGEPDDSEALSAARKLHEQIAGSGLTWDELLVPDTDAAAETEPDDSDDADEEDEGEESEESEEGKEDTAAPEVDDEVVPTGDAADDIKLIDRLLERKGISANLREELDGYKEDIKEGDFTTGDRQYLNALRKRLSSASKSRTKD